MSLYFGPKTINKISTMNGEKRTRLVNEIRNRYTLPQLEVVFYSAMNERLETYVIDKNLESIVIRLLEALEREEVKLLRFLSYLQVTAPWPQLRSAINEYFGIKTADPFETTVAYGVPIIDRQEIRNDLRQLFNQQLEGYYYQALLAQGERSSGRSHVLWLIQYVTQNINIEYLPIDLAKNTLADVILEIKNRMFLPPDRFPDSIAQSSKQSRAFCSALGGYLRDQLRHNPDQITRWCLVFDHYDLDEVDPEARLFVDDLVKFSVDSPTLNLWVIVLGFTNLVLMANIKRVLPTGLIQFGKRDIENFLIKVGNQRGIFYSPSQLKEMCDTILNLLNPPPWSKDEMHIICDRLRRYIIN